MIKYNIPKTNKGEAIWAINIWFKFQFSQFGVKTFHFLHHDLFISFEKILVNQ
jgi:hypothetical protein